MQKKLLVAALGTLFAMPVLAEDAPAAAAAAPAAAAPAAAPAPVFTSNVGFVSNYIYRGMTQTGGKPTIQGGFDYTPASGFYVGVWGSGISWISNLAQSTSPATSTPNSAGTEIDTYLGFRNTFATDFSYDVGFLRYNYPGNYGTVTSADTNEVYGLIGYKWITAKYSYSLSNLFGALNTSDTSYFDLSANYAVGDSGYTLIGHYGKQNFSGSGATVNGTSLSYTDYKLAVTKDISSWAKDLSGTTIGLTYTNTNAGSNPNYVVLGKKLGEGVAVLSVNRTF